MNESEAYTYNRRTRSHVSILIDINNLTDGRTDGQALPPRPMYSDPLRVGGDGAASWGSRGSVEGRGDGWCRLGQM